MTKRAAPPFLIQSRLSNVIKGYHARGANPEPRTLNPQTIHPVFSEEIENILDIPIGECYSNIIS